MIPLRAPGHQPRGNTMEATWLSSTRRLDPSDVSAGDANSGHIARVDTNVGPRTSVETGGGGRGTAVTHVTGAAADRFRRLVDAHFAFIWRSLRGLGVPRDHVDDAAQHVFLVASQKLDAIVVGSERSFLFSTAVGVAANARRSLGRTREVKDDEALVRQADERPSPEQSASSSEARRVLDRILAELPDEQRTVFVLFELEGMTTAEIADLLGTPRGTVASRLRRAREEFQSACTRERARATKGDL